MSQIAVFNTQTASGTGSSAAPVFGATPTNGNALVIVVVTNAGAINQVSSISQTGCSYTRQGNASKAKTDVNIEVWVAPGVSGAGTTPTITLASSQIYKVSMFEVSGIVTSSATDVATGNTATSAGSPVSATVTTAMLARTVEVLICGIGSSSATDTTALLPGGYTQITGVGSVTMDLITGYRIYADTPAAESVSISATGSPTLNLVGFVIGLRVMANKLAIRNADTTSGTNATGSLVLTMPKTPIKGNVVFVTTSTTTTAAVTTAVAATGITFTKDNSETALAPALTMWRGEVFAVSPSGTITITGGAVETVAHAFEVFGLKTGGFDKSATNTGISTAPDSGTTTATSQADELAVAVLADSIHQSPTTLTAGYTQMQGTLGAVTLGMTTAYQILTATGAQNCAGAILGGGAWAGGIATYREGAPAAGAVIQDLITSDGIIPFRR